MNTQTIAAIYAVSENGVIGKDNDLPWKLKDDLKFFMNTTMGFPIIMGRKSFESLGKPLPKRRNIVISRNPTFNPEGVEMCRSLEEAIDLLKEEALIFITGGAGVYKESIDKGYVNKIFETLVHADVEGDTFFKLPNPDNWEITDVDARQADDRNEYAYTFRTLIKKA
ncbi:MAG: dihydrofolate reductase [Bacteroidia bacterium]|nr:dihydrofolate reductase [Bacteroidia bacterium]